MYLCTEKQININEKFEKYALKDKEMWKKFNKYNIETNYIINII